MKSAILISAATLVGFALWHNRAPEPPQPIALTHAPSQEVATAALPTVERSAEPYPALVVGPGTLPTFHGYDCTIDCSGHEAGYEWAEENGIDDPDDCGGNSESFIEGCRAYAEEQASDATNEDDGNDDENSEEDD